MTKQEFETAALASVKSVYVGKAGKCCCGCSGKYAYAAAHQAAASEARGYAATDDEVNDREVRRVFHLVQSGVDEPTFELDPGWASVTFGKKMYTVYFE
jgi:hypothetical protein